MITIESKAKANTGVLFKGYVAGVTISPQIDKVMAEIRLVTATIQMDRKRESCSFQKKETKYTEILSETAGKDGGLGVYPASGQPVLAAGNPGRDGGQTGVFRGNGIRGKRTGAGIFQKRIGHFC